MTLACSRLPHVAHACGKMNMPPVHSPVPHLWHVQHESRSQRSMAALDVGVLTQLLSPLLQLNAQAAGLAAAASNNSLPGLGLNSMSTGDLRAPNSLSANDLRALGSHPSLWQAGQVCSLCTPFSCGSG